MSNFIRKFTKRDLIFSLLTGLITGTLGWKVLVYLKISEFHHIPWMALVVIVPVVWILGVLAGYLLGRWFEFFNQFGKFCAIGFTNFAVNAGVLNFLLSQTGYVKGLGYLIISTAAFLAALVSSYFWNKYWAFRSSNQTGGSQEFGKFFVVTVVTFFVNLAVASIVVNWIHPIFGLNAHQWANAGIIAGSAAGIIFSFVGFRNLVFK